MVWWQQCCKLVPVVWLWCETCRTLTVQLSVSHICYIIAEIWQYDDVWSYDELILELLALCCKQFWAVHLMCQCWCAALHHGRHTAPRAASGPGRVLHRAHDAIPRRRCSARRAGLHFILDGTLRRERPLNRRHAAATNHRHWDSGIVQLTPPQLFTAYRLNDVVLTARLP